MTTATEKGFFKGLLPWDAEDKNNQATGDAKKIDSLNYCHFFMNTVTCNSCMAPKPVYIPREF